MGLFDSSMAGYGAEMSTLSSAGYPMSTTGSLINAAPYQNVAMPSASSGMSGASAMGYAGAITAVIGAVGNFFLAKTQAKAQKSSLQFQADMNRINAQAAESTAQSILDAGQKTAGRVTMQYGKAKSSQRAVLAANGVDLGVGNAAEVQASTDWAKEVDKNTIDANAIRSAWGYKTQGVNFGNQATMLEASSKSINPTSSGAATFMDSASRVSQNWYALYKSGTFN